MRVEVKLDAKGKGYRQLNSEVRQALEAGATQILLDGVNGHYYLGAGLRGNQRLVVNGTPGNDTACYLDGPEMVIYGNAQDGLGNTMNNGRVIVHGGAGDVLGYGMRGGELFIRDSVGYRGGIHMKEFKAKCPVIVIGKSAGSFLGEYMAGGRIVLLGLDSPEGQIIGRHCGSGMHGGCMYIRDTVDRDLLSPDIMNVPLSESDEAFIRMCVSRYGEYFGLAVEQLPAGSFLKLVPRGNRPYARLYAGV